MIVEGEEEMGGRSLGVFVAHHRELLSADVALISDSTMAGPEQPAIICGLRGMVYTFVDIDGPAQDLHSGSFGGAVNNPFNVLGHLIAALKDPAGRILIPGFYDKVLPLGEAERVWLAKSAVDDATWMSIAGISESWGEPGYSIAERTGARPTLDVHGVVGGYMGAGAKTVLPAHAHAKISMRLVPDQDPQEIASLFSDYVTTITPPGVKIRVTIYNTAKPWVTGLDTPGVRAAENALLGAFGRAPVFRREGGSIPVVSQFEEYLGVPSVLMGFGLADDQIHAPNERFYLPNYYKGIAASIRFLREFAG
jgi:acetylornithine deacetylase/succinyl-diaminopimelate desuccinylase-like protein